MQTRKPVGYTVIVRLPFNRGDFVDPEPVEWDAVKDKALWKIISKGSDSSDLDWQDIADRFDVSLDFLLKQAAWLYQRHFAGVKKQMQRLVTTTAPSTRSTEVDGSSSPGPATSTLQRASSKSSRNVPSPIKRDSPVPAEESWSVSRPSKPPFSRTPSAATITQSRLFTSGRAPTLRPPKTASGSLKAPTSPTQAAQPYSEGRRDTQMESSRSAASERSLLACSQSFHQPPFSRELTTGGTSSEGDIEDEDDEDEDNSSGAFLPFATGARQDPSATLREEPPRQTTTATPRHKGMTTQPISSSNSSASSMPPPLAQDDGSREPLAGARPGALSPKHRSQLQKLSPRSTHRDIASDGTPSMGSSFSDLDDAGISASAIEDAVLSMQAGGVSIASRVSGLSQAFRSQK